MPTLVRIALFRPGPNDIDVPVKGYIECTPSRRRTIDTEVILPQRFSTHLGKALYAEDGVTLLGAATPGVAWALLEATDTGPYANQWAWHFNERTDSGGDRYCLVPTSGTTLEYTDLVDVDIESFDPIPPPSPAWVAALGALHATITTETTDAIGVAVAALVGGAPGALDTLNELAAAMGDDANFAAAVAASLSSLTDIVETLATAIDDEATLARNADNLTSGTVADARIPGTIARTTDITAAVDAEVTARDTAISDAITALVGGAPGALDTLNELAAAINDDASFASTVVTALAGKASTTALADEATLARNADNLTSGTVDPARTTTRHLPAYAGRRTNPYNPALCVYNWKASNTRKIRSGLAKAMAGAARSHLLFIGDSATDGRTGGVGVYDRLNAWPLVMRDLLAVGNGVPIGGDGVIHAARPGGAQDPRVTAVGAWNLTSFAYATVAAAGATLTFVPVHPCTTVEVWYSRNSGTFTASMDGASSGPGYAAVTPDGGTGWAKVTLTGTLGLHTIVFTTTSNSATSCANINPYADTGLVVQNCGYSGSSINDWITYTLWYQLAGVAEGTQPSPRDAVFFALGGNDIILHGRTPTQMKADMVTLLTRWAPYYGDKVLVVPNQAWPASVPNATWDEWAGYAYDLADQFDIPLIDYYGRVGSNASAALVGYHDLDPTHMNAAGYRDQGRQAASILGS